MTTVSVIIPTYNRAALVTETIDSVLCQDYENIEIMVVDDGSTDDTLLRLKQYGDRIRVVPQENRGVNAARNHGLRLTAGEYVALLDSDDLWMPQTVSRLATILDEYPDVGFVFSNFRIVRSGGSDISNGLGTWYPTPSGPGDILERRRTVSIPAYAEQTGSADLYTGDIYRASLHHPCVLPSASLYRRSLAGSIAPLPEFDSTCGDWEFFARLSKRHGAAFLNWDGAINRSHEDEVRLTRLDESIQLERRVALVERVWLQDRRFMEEHGREVLDVLYDIHCMLMRAYLNAGRSGEAGQLAARYDAYNGAHPDARLRSWNRVARVPGIDIALPTVRRLYHRAKSLLDRTGSSNP